MAFCKHSDFIKVLPCNENNIILFSLIASVITKGKQKQKESSAACV